MSVYVPPPAPVGDDPTIPEGFPDLFVYRVKEIIASTLLADPDYSAGLFITRMPRPDDPTRTIAVVENDAEPVQYEIGGRIDPSMLRWSVWVMVFVKHSNEVEGRNVRKRLMSRVRKAIFLPSSVQTLMTLSDDTERVSAYRMRRIEYQAADARDRNNQFFFLGMIELTFDTELL